MNQLYIIMLVMFLVTAAGCQKSISEPEEEKTTTCNFTPAWNQGAVCKGKFIRSGYGVYPYQNIVRDFHTSGPNSLDFNSSYIDSSGNLVVFTTVRPRMICDIDGYPVMLSAVPGNAVVFDPTLPGDLRFDTCTGILYMKYSWSNYTRQFCDTCVFR